MKKVKQLRGLTTFISKSLTIILIVMKICQFVENEKQE